MAVELRDVVVDSEGGSLAGLLAIPDHEPVRGIVLALHGGGYGAAYWGYPTDPARSLFVVGARLGFAVLALDRQGYGVSSGSSNPRVDRQAVSLLEVVESLPERTGLRGPAFVVGHSLGSIVALEMAARDTGQLTAVAISGLPVRYPAHTREHMASWPVDGTHLPVLGEDEVRAIFFGPDGTFDPAMFAADVAMQAPVPIPEFLDARDAPEWFPMVAPRIRIPVQYVIADDEAAFEGGPATLEYGRAAFSAASHVDAFLQAGSGHNISRHHVARAYHLRVFAFFEERLALSEAGG